MAKTTLCNVRVESTKKAEYLEVLGRAFGYQPMVHKTVDKESRLVANPESLEAFVKRMGHEFFASRYEAQMTSENPVSVTFDADSV